MAMEGRENQVAMPRATKRKKEVIHTYPPCTTYPVPNPKLIMRRLSRRATSSKRKFRSKGGLEENVYPGRDGTMIWYGKVSGVYCCLRMDMIGRNSRKLPISRH